MERGKEPSFSWLVLGKAVYETKEFFGSTTRDVVVGILLAALGFANYYRQFGLPAVRDEFISAFYSTFEPLMLVVLMVFVWHLWLAPSALAYEAARRAMSEKPPLSKPPERAPYERPVNWAIWKQREGYDLHELASILAKVDPSYDPATPEALGFLRLVTEDAMGGRLRFTRDRNAEPHQQPDLWPTYFNIRKVEALTWAKAKGFDLSHIT